MCICIITLKNIAKITITPKPVTKHKSSPLSSFQIATWNIRVPFPIDNDNGHAYSSRMPCIAQTISIHKPDILGLQEDCYFTNQDLLFFKDTNLYKYYERYGLFNRNGESYPSKSWPENAFTNDGMNDGEHNSVWWRKDKFTCLDTFTFWLSNHPNIPGSSFDEITGRIVNCVLLQDILHNKHVLGFCSTHMPANDTKIDISINVLEQQLIKWREKISNPKMVLFVVGDFNFNPSSFLYINMKQHDFLDLRSISPLRGDNIDTTTNDWYKPYNQILDYVWSLDDHSSSATQSSLIRINSIRHISARAELSSQQSNNYNNIPMSIQKTASDHLMVLTNVSWL